MNKKKKIRIPIDPEQNTDLDILKKLPPNSANLIEMTDEEIVITLDELDSEPEKPDAA